MTKILIPNGCRIGVESPQRSEELECKAGIAVQLR